LPPELVLEPNPDFVRVTERVELLMREPAVLVALLYAPLLT
jgi:hypothetical protein